MVRHAKVFIWKEITKWKPVIDCVFEDILTHSVIERLRCDPPEYFYSDDLTWLEKYIENTNFSGSLETRFIERFPEIYSHIRVFHACRPLHVGDYYKKGLRVLDIREWQELFRKYFSPKRFPELTNLLLDDAIKEVSPILRKGYSCLALDDRLYIEVAGHYLIYGSEYLLALIAQLERISGRSYRNHLKEYGVPTIFHVNLPIELIDYQTMKEFANQVLSQWAKGTINTKDESSVIGFSFVVRRNLSPGLIRDHVHPKRIRDPHNGFLDYEHRILSCEYCNRGSARKD